MKIFEEKNEANNVETCFNHHVAQKKLNITEESA